MTLGTIFDFFKFFFFNLGKEATDTLITIASSFLMVLVGSIISRKSSRDAIAASNKNAIDLLRRQEFNVAAAKLRAAYAPTQARLHLSRMADEHQIGEYFDTAIPVHAAAVEEFRPFASDSHTYQQAWDNYRKAIYDDDEFADAELRWWSGKTIKDGEMVNFLLLIEKRIKDVLHFAAPK